ncbi:MAG: OmpA family protein, partial [Pseudomonadota bacterium]
HTDASGPAAMNQRLSEERANAVRNALVAAGVTSVRLVSEGRGEAQPIASNRTPEGRARNRRIEFEIQ